VTVIQRFNSALDVSPHFHVLFLDGVYSFGVAGRPVFPPTAAPRDDDIACIAAAVFRRVERKLADHAPGRAQRRFIVQYEVVRQFFEEVVRQAKSAGWCPSSTSPSRPSPV